jgi:tight adherence protein C
MPRNGGVAAAAIIGMLLPDYVVRRRRKRYLNGVQAGLADALDMMVICSEAGLGMESALSRVATEIGQAHPAVADELLQTVSELRVAADRRTAMLNMGLRTGLAGLKRLGATLIQTQQYGTPLSQALRTLSAELRQEMLVRFEERAARLPVLLTVPMIVFILPTVFIVVGGPAMLSVYASMH